MSDEAPAYDLFTNLAAERGLLGYLIRCPAALATIVVSEELFSRTEHRQVLNAVVELHAKGGAVDTVVLADTLRTRAVLGPASLVEELVGAAGVDHIGLLKILNDCQKRRALDAISSTLNMQIRQFEDVDRIVADARTTLTGLSVSSHNEFSLIDDEDILKEPIVAFLVAQVLPARSLCLLVGRSGTAKTFLALDMALAVASGRPWHGHQVRKGPVIYVAAEGWSGLGSRIRAWKARHNQIGQHVGVQFLQDAVDPLDGGQIGRLLHQLRQRPEPPALIIIDTWSKCLAAGSGDEDKAKDVNRAIVELTRFVQELGATILLLHHEGHAVKGRGRGSSALRAGVDMEASLSKVGHTIVLSNTKQRDTTEFHACAFRLCEQELEGAPSSCVLEPATTPQKKGASEAWVPTAKATKVLEALSSFGPNGAAYGHWREKADTSETTFRRIRRDLVAHGYVTQAGKQYSVTDKGTEYSRDRQTTANGGSGGDNTNSHQPPHPFRGGGDGGESVDQEGRFDSMGDEVEL